MMLDTYKSEKIEFCMSARIHPTDNSIPDCVCIIALSGQHLFVIEDNYDGTYTDHFIIERKHIDDVLISVPDKNEKKPEPGSAADLRKKKDFESAVRKTPWLLLGFKRPKEFIEVIYNDNDLVKQHLYLDECDRNMKEFVKAFKK